MAAGRAWAAGGVRDDRVARERDRDGDGEGAMVDGRWRVVVDGRVGLQGALPGAAGEVRFDGEQGGCARSQAEPRRGVVGDVMVPRTRGRN